MVVRVYVEGGGDHKEGKAKVREGFSQFLYNALGKRVKVIACGGRDRAYRDFKNGLKRHPNAFNILLVDAEGPVAKNNKPWLHLQERDKWQKPPGVTDEQCHLMVQAFEAWLMADVEVLKKFYGQNFNSNPIPERSDVEKIPKNGLESTLKMATKNTQKGEYHKIRHGPDILAQLDSARLRKKASYCERLLVVLAKRMQ
jgi:hypothetical protein